MKTWKCTVCGYIQRSEAPPEKCPVCGADRSKFIEIVPEKESKPDETERAARSPETPAPKSEAPEPKAAKDVKTWKCTVCGYIQRSEDPPEKCPVCGADRSKFIEIFPEGEAEKTEDAAEPASATEAEEAPKAKSETKSTVKKPGTPPYVEVYNTVTNLMSENHIHPISVHIPNGVLPVSVIFAIIAVLFQNTSFGAAAFYNLVFVLLAMPMVLFSGYNDWQKIYGGNMTPLFYTKIICGGVVLVTCLILVIWRALDPNVTASSGRWIFLFIHLIMLAAAGIAGHLGGKLVFNKN
jgi:rubredoxin/uncharacterized membrane protein